MTTRTRLALREEIETAVRQVADGTVNVEEAARTLLSQGVAFAVIVRVLAPYTVPQESVDEAMTSS